MTLQPSFSVSVFTHFLFHEKLCVKHYASFCIFMQSKNVYLYNIMINRKLWNFYKFSEHLRKSPIFLLFVFSLFLLFWINYRKQKQKRKSLIFAVFAVICPFLSQIKRLFSVIYDYIGQITPHPPLLALAGWVSSLPKIFYFFYFLFFVKYYDFANSAFLLNFDNFFRISYLLFFLYKVS